MNIKRKIYWWLNKQHTLASASSTYYQDKRYGNYSNKWRFYESKEYFLLWLMFVIYPEKK